jgi:hypothetical protein
MEKMDVKSLNSLDESRSFAKGNLLLLINREVMFSGILMGIKALRQNHLGG